MMSYGCWAGKTSLELRHTTSLLSGHLLMSYVLQCLTSRRCSISMSQSRLTCTFDVSLLSHFVEMFHSDVSPSCLILLYDYHFSDIYHPSYFPYLLRSTSLLLYSPWLLRRFLLSLLYLFCIHYCSTCLRISEYCPLPHLYISLDVSLVYGTRNIESPWVLSVSGIPLITPGHYPSLSFNRNSLSLSPSSERSLWSFSLCSPSGTLTSRRGTTSYTLRPSPTSARLTNEIPFLTISEIRGNGYAFFTVPSFRCL